jgi:hypothetical protein
MSFSPHVTTHHLSDRTRGARSDSDMHFYADTVIHFWAIILFLFSDMLCHHHTTVLLKTSRDEELHSLGGVALPGQHGLATCLYTDSVSVGRQDGREGGRTCTILYCLMVGSEDELVRACALSVGRVYGRARAINVIMHLVS